MHKKLAVFILSIVFSALVSMPASACVGKTLVIGAVNRPDMNTMSQMLSILINERTGTTVVSKSFNSFPALMDAMKNGKIDIMIDYSGRCYIDVLGKKPEKNPAKVFSTVKEMYQRDKNQIWLEPFGFSEKGVITGKCGDTPAVAAPILRKTTLEKFPALPRVLDKLAAKVSNATIIRLSTESRGGNIKKVTRKFLKENRLI